MSEIWTPNDQDAVDASNVFEMAMYLQDGLDRIFDDRDYEKQVYFALNALSEHLNLTSQLAQPFYVDSRVTLLEDKLRRPIATIENAQLYGFPSEINEIKRDDLPRSLAIKMEALSIVWLEDSERASEDLQIVNVPVSQIVRAKVA